MSSSLDYTLDILGNSPSEIARIAERLQRPSAELVSFVANESSQPVKEITEGLKDLHWCSMALSGLFGHGWAAFLIPNAVMQDYPDRMTEAMRNHADGLVVS